MFVSQRWDFGVYQDEPQETWGEDNNNYINLFDSLQTTYDGTLGTYNYMDQTTVSFSPIIFSILQIVNLFIINILMLNFMVAILSTTYENMLESGAFKYKCKLFEYCEKYEIAKDDPNIGEIVIHPPPINVICTLMFPFFILPANQFNELMPKVCSLFSKTNFWFENTFFIIMFIIFELALAPLVYLKTFYTLIFSSRGAPMKVLNTLRWGLLGIFYLLFMLGKDVVILVHILRMYDGCKAFKEQGDLNIEDDEVSVERQCELFNEVRLVVIKHYLKIRYQLKGGEENKALSKKDLQPSNFPDILALFDQDEKCQAIQEQAQLFQVKYTLLLEEWK